MNIFLYTILFIMGTIFGSFLTLATYRIPLNQDITHKHSYCPKCNHLLSFTDMIPLLSYIFLGGKCRYCKTKISPRYFIIEILSGLSFIFLGYAIGFNIDNLTINKIVELWIGILYIVFIFLIAEIDKEHRYIDDRVLIYGFTISMLNMIFQYLTDKDFNINRLIIYLFVIAIMIFINIIQSKKGKKHEYTINLVLLCIIINLFIYEISTIIMIIFTLLIIAIKLLINKIINKGKEYNGKMPIALYLSIANILTLIIISFRVGGII